MSPVFPLEELSSSINNWCAEHGVVPANGQAGNEVSERTVRYYRTLGLVDAPSDGGYGEKHLLQLTAIRLLQAQGLPLRRIRELLHGRSLDDLREVRRRGLNDIQRAGAGIRLPIVSGGDELWRTTALDNDFLLISRRGTSLSPAQRAAILLVLQSETAKP